MDDILKRMLAVESEADKIVEEAQAQAEKIMEEARRKVHAQHAEAQEALAHEVDALVASRIDAAQQAKGAKLAEQNRRTDEEMAAFRQSLAPQVSGITEELLFGCRQGD